MNRRVKMVAAFAAVALLLAGGAIAAVSATGRRSGHGARAGLRNGGQRDVRTASEYLGVPASQLQGELRAGKSLAQIAQATHGHSVSGLSSALLASKRARLSKIAAALPQRVQAEVARAGGPGRAGRGLAGRRASVAGYIGISPQELRAELESRKTLTEIARAHGRSEAGLVAALVTARRHALERAVSAGRITQQREAALLPMLEARMRKLVNASLAPR